MYLSMPEFGNFAERRAYPRYILSLEGNAEALYRRDLDVAYQDPELKGMRRFRIDVVNVSKGGFLLTYDTEISSGDSIRMFFIHPARKEEIVLEGQVAWMRKNVSGIGGRYCGGISFRNTSEEAIDDLVGFAASRHPTPLI